MAWNLFLAAVPALLAHNLFRRGRRPSGWWFLGLVGFALFLPNAPYVISDVVHLPGDLSHATSRSSVVLGLLPSYAVYMFVGVLSYAYCIGRIRRWLGAQSWDPAWIALELGIHLAAAVGVMLGRVARLNSWDAVIHPFVTLWRSAAAASHPSRVVAVVAFATFLFLVCRALSGAAWLARQATIAIAGPRTA